MSITNEIKLITQRIRALEITYGRNPGEVKLLAVSKGHAPHAIQEAFMAGISDFGENYLQEAQPKLKALSTLPLIWHFIGPIQSNKTKQIALAFSWIHSICHEKTAAQLNNARLNSMPPLNVCIQVNFDEEISKSGASPSRVHELAKSILKLPNLQLRGLMLLPKPRATTEAQYLSFLRLTQLLHELNNTLHLSMDTLSMGMSGDMEAAVRAGSTLVRIGTAIFGNRTNSGSHSHEH